jgi:hypothetical protein
VSVSRSSLAAASAFAVFSLTLVGFGGHLLLGERAFRGRAAHLAGRIEAKVVQPGDENGPTVYCPKLAFTRPDGTRATRVGESCDSDPAWRQGQVVPLLWDPRPPHRVELPGYDHAWLLDGFVLGLGILFAGAAVATLFI